MRKKIVSLFLLTLPLVALFELWAHRYFRNAAPSQQAWLRLKPAIVALKRPSDLVTVVPHWADPLLRHALGSDGTPIDVLARPDDDTLERVIEVSFFGARAASFRGWKERERHREGPFLLRILENPRPATARMRLIDRVSYGTLEVFDGPVTAREPCPYTTLARSSAGNLGGEPTFGPRRFACRAGEPYLVTVTTIDDEHFAPRRCIWAHPTPRGPLVLRFHDVWLGDKLVGHGGLPWLLARDGAGTPIHLVANFEGASIGEAVIEDTKGWQRFEWATPDRRDRRGSLELVVASADHRERRFCFTLESR